MKNANGFRYFRLAHSGCRQTGYQCSSAWSGLPAPELTAVCARGMTVSNLFGDKFRDTLLGGSETLVSNVVHRSLKPAKTSSCVCDTTHQKLHDIFSLHASSTVKRAPPRLEIGMTNEHTISKGRREGRQTLNGGAPSFSTEPLEYSPQTLDSIVRPMLGAELHAPQEVRPIGHPAPRSCRGNDACATGRPLQTPGLLQVLVCQTISRNWCGHLHLAGNLFAMSATHSTNQVSTKCWLGTLPLRLRSTSVL